jgi:hypothetical protein
MAEGGRRQGPAFGDAQGQIMSSRLLEGMLMERLQVVKDKKPGVIPNDVDCYEDFGISRSFRRSEGSSGDRHCGCASDPEACMLFGTGMAPCNGWCGAVQTASQFYQRIDARLAKTAAHLSD